jgi:hypothetical protein
MSDELTRTPNDELLNEALDPPAGSAAPDATYSGNSIDLTSFGALISALLLAFLCITCNMGYYCLPFFPIVLGIVGLISAEQSANPQRTRMFSWIGVGVGGGLFLILTMLIVGYFLFFGTLAALTEGFTR